MFEQILQEVKDHLGNNPQLAGNIPPEQADAIHQEIATHIHEGVQGQSATAGAGILSQIESSISSGGLLTSAISGGLVGSLASKFGLSPAITGAIAAAVPGLLQKYMHKNAEQAGAASTATPA